MLKGIFIILLLIIMGCTEKVGIEPEFNDNTDWAPQITVEYSNYRRVNLNFGEWPPLEFRRNLANLFLQFRIFGEARFRRTATFELPNGGFRRFYRSNPVLPEGIEYEARLAVQYRNGVERVSNIAPFFMPVVKGEILESIAMPQNEVYGGSRLQGFGVTETAFFVLTAWAELLRIDRNTLTVTLLQWNFRPDNSYEFIDMNVHEDKVIFADNVWDETVKINVIQFNLLTRAITKSLQLSFSSSGDRDILSGRIFHYDGSDIFVLWSLDDDQQQIQQFDAVTGAVVASYPAFAAFISDDDKIVYDGKDFWISINGNVDNRISVFELNGKITPVHQNPVYNSTGLAWDGDNFWVFNRETGSLVKLKLEGL